MRSSPQKDVPRKPRVHIEYEVEHYGSTETVSLPFVVGVLADLAGDSEEPPGAVEDRKFDQLDVDTFDDKMKDMKPRATFRVPNTLTGEGEMSVDLTFESMEDFSPAAVARKVDSLNNLLTAREQLENLLARIDGKRDAENMIAELLQDHPRLQAIASGAERAEGEEESSDGEE
jgi:type VI secretion system protein ImpB